MNDLGSAVVVVPVDPDILFDAKVIKCPDPGCDHSSFLTGFFILNALFENMICVVSILSG